MSGWPAPRDAAAAMECGDGADVRIAVLDSGIEIGHPEFSGSALRGDFIVEPSEIHDGQGEDLYGHGTAIAGIIWKLAPRAEIGSYRVLGPNLSARTAQVCRAAHLAIESGYQILHCSFACGMAGHLPLYKEWVDRACVAGVHVVAASASHARPEWPAHFPSVIGVDCNLTEEPGMRSVAGRLVEFTAPGSQIDAAWKGGTRRLMTGSSFAAAHVTGRLARMLSIHPGLPPLQVKALLRAVTET